MKIMNDVDLKKYTTIHIGGTAKRLMVPESIEELQKIVHAESPQYFLGGGSNLLINDREFDMVVSLREFSPEIIFGGDGLFHVGASVRLQKLILFINEHGYGGIEYLYSVPGLVGGAVAMNAGRGKSFNKSISDYIESITVLKNGELQLLKRNDCNFSYRNSLFKGNPEYVVCSVDFKFAEQDEEESSRLRSERMQLCKDIQDNSAPNFGSVFMDSDIRIMKFIKRISLKKGKARMSGKTANWMLNTGDASYDDAVGVIQKVEKLHRFFGKTCSKEVVIWE